jgi:4a-hydroxytetrahydrobiopterin dehydratase
MTDAAVTLAKERCIPCRGDTPRLTETEATGLSSAVPNWRMAANPARIERGWRFPDFVTALAFVQQISIVAEASGHHPDIAFGWGYAALSLHTHAIGGLHRNDFILAARIDALGVATLEKEEPTL